MPFTSLSSRLNSLPDVLVGPVLRLVLPDQVSVFFACSKARKVTLEVFPSEFDGTGLGRIMVGTRSTTKLADKLHVVCVTARGAARLQPDTAYYYDARFGAPGNDAVEAPAASRLYTDGVIRAQADQARALLTYPGGAGLPSFVMPPSDVSRLRILHASCRKAHAPGLDALPTGDEIVASSFTSLERRPYQLYLTGDQIYADDVAMPMLHLLIDAAAALGLPVEQLPLKAGAAAGSTLAPGTRGPAVTDDAGFTSTFGPLGMRSDVADSHLMTFADYALMYAFAWSDVLWPGTVQGPDDALTPKPADLPGVADVFTAEWTTYKAELKAYADSPDEGAPPREDKRFKKVAEQVPHVADYRATLPKVRRLLANTPTLMIFDDHEITDDWNLNLKWEKRVYDPNPPASKPTALGRAIIRNGLAAYAVFQAWGNTPEQFDPAAPDHPGVPLLEALATWNGQPAAAEATTIATCVGIPDAFTDHVATKPAGALRWHYGYEWAEHQLIVLDTRTERGAADAAEPNAPPALIYDQAVIDRMARPVPPLVPGPDTLVIAIAPGPVFGVPLHEATGRYVHAPSIPILSPRQKANSGMDPEHWALTPYSRERLLAALLSRRPPGPDGVVRGRVVLLGGDVHHASAVRVRYHGVRPPGHEGAPVEGVVAQLTSSALKNESGLTHLIETVGFGTFDQRGEVIAGPKVPITHVNGWDNGGAPRGVVGIESIPTPGMGPTQEPITLDDDPGIYEFTFGAAPGTSPPPNASGVTYTLSVPPEWRYEVRPQQGVLRERGTPASIGAGIPADRTDKVRLVGAAAREHQRASVNYGSAQRVVGRNNIGDVGFVWGAGDDKRVLMDLWFRREDTAGAARPFTRFEIFMDLT